MLHLLSLLCGRPGRAHAGKAVQGKPSARIDNGVLHDSSTAATCSSFGSSYWSSLAPGICSAVRRQAVQMQSEGSSNAVAGQPRQARQAGQAVRPGKAFPEHQQFLAVRRQWKAVRRPFQVSEPMSSGPQKSKAPAAQEPRRPGALIGVRKQSRGSYRKEFTGSSEAVQRQC